MKEGEKRKLFVHPDLGYGTQGQLPPNALLIFEVEIVKADAPSQISKLPALGQEKEDRELEEEMNDFDDDFDEEDDFDDEAIEEEEMKTPSAEKPSSETFVPKKS